MVENSAVSLLILGHLIIGQCLPGSLQTIKVKKLGLSHCKLVEKTKDTNLSQKTLIYLTGILNIFKIPAFVFDQKYKGK